VLNTLVVGYMCVLLMQRRPGDDIPPG
jgi:hypothetical protein